MKAFIFKPSNEFIGKLSVTSNDQLPDELKKFLAHAGPVPAYSYVEMSGRTWTVTGQEPLQLQEGRVAPQPSDQVTEYVIKSPQSTEIDIIATGAGLIVIGLVIGIFAYAHRPPDGFVDAMNRAGSWAFKPGVYYVVLFIAIACGLAGILRIAKVKKAPRIAKFISGGEGSSLDEIRKAKELLDAGAIDETEFKKIKQRALER
jgi:hypothetical protein